MRKTPWLRRLLPAASAALLGALAFLVVGRHPDPGAAHRGGQVDWSLAGSSPAELDAADAVWKKRSPWGATTTEAASPPPPPTYLPAGVVGAGASMYAVFIAPGQPEVRLRAGDALPGGGKVTGITRSRISWVDAQGAKHGHELLADPLPMPMNTP